MSLLDETAQRLHSMDTTLQRVPHVCHNVLWHHADSAEGVDMTLQHSGHDAVMSVMLQAASAR